MEKVVEHYMIVNALTGNVNSMLLKGWQPLGSPFSYELRQGHVEVKQVMVKYKGGSKWKHVKALVLKYLWPAR